MRQARSMSGNLLFLAPDIIEIIDSKTNGAVSDGMQTGLDYVLDNVQEILQNRLENGKNLMENNPNVQFIDYTKIANRLLQKLPKNYSLTYSQAENNLDNVKKVLKTKYNIATVFRKKLPEKWLGRRVIDGDKHDLRHLDPKKIIVGLRAKGRAIKNFNGFVQDV